MTRLILIRHGESVSTVARRIGGARTCGGLSPLGFQQAERLRQRLTETAEIRADVLMSSHYLRAQQTADAIAPALGGLPIIQDAGFGEHDPGPICDGLLYTEFMKQYGIDESAWESGNPFDVTFPGGETIADFHFRVGQALRRTMQTYAAQTVVISCHGGVVDAILRFALKAPSMGLFEIHTLNTSLTEIQLMKPNQWRLWRYNDTAHLAGLPASTPHDNEQ